MFYDHFSAHSLLAKLGRLDSKKNNVRVCVRTCLCNVVYVCVYIMYITSRCVVCLGGFDFDFIECFTTTFLCAHSWLNWVEFAGTVEHYIMQPCRHGILCQICRDELTRRHIHMGYGVLLSCPICRTDVFDVERVYL